MINSEKHAVKAHIAKEHVEREKNGNHAAEAPTGLCHPVEICVDIYVSENCFVCDYAYEVASTIEREFPQVNVRMINLQTSNEKIPDIVFATPTYVLNGRVWSLGNPSLPQVREKLRALV